MKLTKDHIGKKVWRGLWEENSWVSFIDIKENVGMGWTNKGEALISGDMQKDIWSLYVEPQKTVKMAQALVRTQSGRPRITQHFYKSKEELQDTCRLSEILEFPLDGKWRDVKVGSDVVL